MQHYIMTSSNSYTWNLNRPIYNNNFIRSETYSLGPLQFHLEYNKEILCFCLDNDALKKQNSIIEFKGIFYSTYKNEFKSSFMFTINLELTTCTVFGMKLSSDMSNYIQNGNHKLNFTIETKETPVKKPELQPVKLINLLKSGLCSDLTIVVGAEVGTPQTYQAHKAILSLQSPVFKVMFEKDMLEAKQNRVEIGEIKPKVFEAFLQFIYGGQLEVDQMDIDLLVAADKYEIMELKTICAKQLSKRLSDQCLQLSQQFNDGTIKFDQLCEQNLAHAIRSVMKEKVTKGRIKKIHQHYKRQNKEECLDLKEIGPVLYG